MGMHHRKLNSHLLESFFVLVWLQIHCGNMRM